MTESAKRIAALEQQVKRLEWSLNYAELKSNNLQAELIMLDHKIVHGCVGFNCDTCTESIAENYQRVGINPPMFGVD